MDQQVLPAREYACPLPVTPENISLPGPSVVSNHGPSPGPSGLQTPASTSGSSTSSSRILSRNTNGTIAMTSQPTNESELQLYRVLQRANLLSYYDIFIGQALFQTPLVPPSAPQSSSPYTVCSPGPPMPPRVPGGPLNLSQPSPVHPMQPSPPMPILSNSNSQSSPSPKEACSPVPPHSGGSHHHLSFQQALAEYPPPPGSPTSLTPVLVEPQIQRLAEAADLLVKTLPPFDPKPQNNKKKICKDLEYVMNMAEDDPRRMDEIRKYAAIYGRFDCKRKPEKPLTLHEVSVNEAAAQICKHIPALLTRRDELFPLARQVVRDSGYQYSKGHSRSQCYSKSFEDENPCKRLRFDGSPGAMPDPNQMEEERKRRQDRLEAVTEQIKLLAGQQHDLKTGLQQSRDTQNAAAVGQIQVQLDHLAGQHYQLVNEQNELSRQLRRLDRYFSEYRYGVRSSCSENDKIDTDDTDSQFSVYSYESSASLTHETNDSPSHDSNQSIQVSDSYALKNSQGKKANAQLTKQLVQETLIDEGLRVVKELANQIKDESHNSVCAPKPEGRPRGRPPRLERDYILTTAGSTVSRHCADSKSGNARNTSPPVTPLQNGHSPISSNNNNNNNTHFDNDSMSCRNGIVFNLRSNHGSDSNSLPVCISDNNNKKVTDVHDDIVNNESEGSLKALLAFSQKGIKQEPSSPNSPIKMD